MDEKYTAFCGLCCVDCIPSNHVFFNLAHNLEEVLSDLQFDDNVDIYTFIFSFLNLIEFNIFS
jgi:hypothetical protein